MGFKFRKSVKMGPVRVNMSKSGIGYSVGGKGMRVTKKAGGGTRTTVGVPGTGISYSSDSKKKSSAKKTPSKKTTASTSSSVSTSGNPGCLGSVGFVIVFAIIVGILKAYWKIILGFGLLIAAVYIACRVYLKNPEEPAEETAVEAPELPQPEEQQPEEPPKPEFEEKKYIVAGVEYYLDALKKMMEPNELYNYKKQELIDICKTDELIYKYTIEDIAVELVPEPDNPHDPKAIKVLINGTHVGYIPARRCAHLLRKINNGQVENIEAVVGGGRYKVVNEDYDVMKDKSKYTMETGEDDYYIELYIREKL